MKLYRKTYAEINLTHLEQNVNKVVRKFKDYAYYIGVVKADCYGHNDIESVKAILQGGCNYLAVATLEEALTIREKIKEVPILCLEVIPKEYLEECIEKDITITIHSKEYLEEIIGQKVKAHIKINTGMNRLGISKQEELQKAYQLALEKNITIEGIYTHIYEANSKQVYQKQIEYFSKMLSSIDKSKIPMIHISASEALVNYEKPEYVNGCRLGIVMYGFSSDKELELESTFSLYSEVIQINELQAGDVVGYNGNYQAKQKEKIAVVAIGYADGIIRKNTGRTVYIHDKEYTIVGNICMDMLFVKVDDSVKVHDKVAILKDIKHIEKVAEYLETIPYEVLCSIGKRVPRRYKK